MESVKGREEKRQIVHRLMGIQLFLSTGKISAYLLTIITALVYIASIIVFSPAVFFKNFLVIFLAALAGFNLTDYYYHGDISFKRNKAFGVPFILYLSIAIAPFIISFSVYKWNFLYILGVAWSGIFSSQNPAAQILILGIYTMGIVGPLIILKSSEFIKEAREQEETLRRIWFINSFEMFPSEGDTPNEILLNKMINGYPRLGLKMGNKKELAKFDADVEGSKSNHKFDIYVEDTSDDFIDKKTSLFVRRLDNKSELEVEDLKKFKEEILDVVKKTRARPLYQLLVWNSSISADALEYVRDKKNWIKDNPLRIGNPIHLVEQIEGRYEVTSFDGL